MPVVKLEVLRLDTHLRNDLFIIFSISPESSALLFLLYHLNLLGSVVIKLIFTSFKKNIVVKMPECKLMQSQTFTN